MPSVFILAMEKICLKHLSAHKALERQRGKHVEAEAEPCDVYDDVCIREIVENIGEGLVFEEPVAGD